MHKLLTIEWLKLRHYRPFWILLGLYFLVLGLVCSSVMLYLQYVASRGAKFESLDPSIIPFYDFSDLWQNITYLATFFKIFLGFVVVISITNEHDYKTIRQHIIDGLTRGEFIVSKLFLVLSLTTINTLFVFLLGLVLGWIYSPVQGWAITFEHAGFLLAYWLDVLAFLMFSMLLGMLIKRTGFAIVLLALYALFLEPIGVLILSNVWEEYTFYQYFPIRAINNLIAIPFAKYFFQEIQDVVYIKDILIVSAYTALFAYASYWLLKVKDLR